MDKIGKLSEIKKSLLGEAVDMVSEAKEHIDFLRDVLREASASREAPNMEEMMREISEVQKHLILTAAAIQQLNTIKKLEEVIVYG